MRLGLAQLTSNENVEQNLNVIEALLKKSAADLTLFPENSLHFRVQAKVRGLELDGPEFARLTRAVKMAALITTAVDVGEKHPVNATVLITPSAPPKILYRKIHLFDVDVPGAPPVRESESFVAGAEAAVWEYQGWKFGLSICYDLRFAELYARYAQKVDVILVPSAFLVPTGSAHWHTLLRARAIESQCYVAAPAQSGKHIGGEKIRETYGHSLLVDPWGEVLVDLGARSPEISVVELDRARIESVRRQIPMAAHRRLK